METFLNILTIISLSLFLVTVFIGLYRVIFVVFGFFPSKKYKIAERKGNFCILVPARNESNVIERLLKSIKAQNYAGKIDVCVIVEDINDKTVEITQSYGYDYFVRVNLNNKGKGYALDEAIKDLKSQDRHYDGYLIIDADNILKDDFVEVINSAYQSGVKVANGYHAPVNKPGNIVADCSLLTFSSINTFQNKARNIFTKNIVMTGTGLFLSSSLIDEWGGWPFHTLTEDYELSYWCTVNNVQSVYLEDAVFYDESAVDGKTLFNQRVRWIKGFSQVKKKYRKEMFKGVFHSNNFLARLDFTLGVLPNICVLLNYFLLTISSFICIVLALLLNLDGLFQAINIFIITNLSLYLFLLIYTIMQLEAEREYFKPNLLQSLKIIFIYPVFIMNYIPQAIKAIFSKEVKWVPIKHGNVEMEVNSGEEQEETSEELEEVI